MPITQDRIISVVTHASTLIKTLDMLRNLAKTIDIRENNILMNSLIAHNQDQTTKDGIMHIYQSLSILHEAITEIEVPQTVRNNIMEEEIHFKKWFKHNKATANYVRVRRSIARNLAASIAQVPTFDWLTQAPTQAPYGQGPTEKPLTIEERIARRKANGQSDEKLAKPRSDSVFPPGETDTLTPAQSAALTPNKAQGHYDPDIISTSVPSIEDMTEDETPADRPVL
jgi:hypothetical protein